MNEAFNTLLTFLDQNNFKKSAKVLQEELDSRFKEWNQKNLNNIESSQKLLRIINKAISHYKTEEKKKKISNQQKQIPKKKLNLLSQEETENIMEVLMSKIVGMKHLLEDEKLNAKIEKLFDNPTFQKMVETTDVFQDISNMSSFTNSLLNKNNNNNNKILDNKILKNNLESSWDGECVPQFGKQNESDVNIIGPDDSLTYNNEKNNKQLLKSNLNNENFSKKQGITKQTRSPSMNDLFTPSEDNSKNPINTPSSNQLNPAQSNKNMNLNKLKISDPQFDVLLDGNPSKMPSVIHAQQNNDSSLFFQNSHSFVLAGLEDQNAQIVDEYVNDDDAGFDLYEVLDKDFAKVSKKLAEKFNFPARGMYSDNKKKKNDKKDKETNKDQNNGKNEEEDSAIILMSIQKKKTGKEKVINDISHDRNKLNDSFTSDENRKTNDPKESKKPKTSIILPEHLKHPPSNDEFYPVLFDNVIYDCFSLKVIYNREKTGFEDTKDFPIVINSVIAGRYQILQYLGSAAFSKAVQCLDLKNDRYVCIKIIENNKDYFDQSVDEIKLLKYINFNGNVDEKNVLKIYEYFYHKEHLFIVTELLKDNLYEYSKLNREKESNLYFTIGRLQKISKQILEGLDFIHSLHLIHCDLKPENILMKSYEKCEVKIIDFGSSCFIHDPLSTYVQSRAYRAPEVIIGAHYDYKIDIWSLGCILAELWTGKVLFQNDTIQGLLAKVIGMIGPIPESMYQDGTLVNNFFTKEKLLYQDELEEDETSHNMVNESSRTMKKPNRTGKVEILVPKKSALKFRLKTDDLFFLDFIRWLLEIDPSKRPTAKEALNHPWFSEAKYQDGL